MVLSLRVRSGSTSVRVRGISIAATRKPPIQKRRRNHRCPIRREPTGQSRSYSAPPQRGADARPRHGDRRNIGSLAITSHPVRALLLARSCRLPQANSPPDCLLLVSRALEHRWPLYRRSNRAGDSPPFPRAFATLAFAYHNHASPARHARPPTLLAMRRPALLKWLISVVLITDRSHLTPLPLRSADERYHRRRFVLTANNNAGMSLPGGVVSTDWTFTSAVLYYRILLYKIKNK